MNGNGTDSETPEVPPEAPGPPPWMHDFLPASCIFDCQGPDCDQAARAYWQNNIGFIAPGWQAMDQRPFCAWLCVARYAAAKAQEQIDTVYPREPLERAGERAQIEMAHAEAKDDRPAPGSITMGDTPKRARHN